MAVHEKHQKKTKQSTHPVRVANEQLLRKREQKTISLAISDVFFIAIYLFSDVC